MFVTVIVITDQLLIANNNELSNITLKTLFLKILKIYFVSFTCKRCHLYKIKTTTTYSK